MKNFIPLILAVVLGLAAVLAVGRLLAARKEAREKTVDVVAAARDVAQGDDLAMDVIMKKEIPMSALPAQSILWSRAEMIIGQKALRPVAQNDYLLLSDVGLSRSMANIVGEGEWAVALNLPPYGVARIVQPGDEVAIVGTFKIKTRVESADLSAPAEEVSKEATLVLFPRVRVLDVGGVSGGPGGEEGSEIIVSLPPQQAQVLIAAQREAQLTLALRRPDDEGTIDRLDAGMVDDATFDSLLTGLKSVVVPKVPGSVAPAEQ
jgi:Flp pilus assembly protein CpaB